MVILEQQEINESIQRIAAEIIENNKSLEDVVLVGIRTGGAFLATRLQETINVYLQEAGFDDHVTIEEKKAA
jgi:pyrimidine operon attenuation protein/uracil phosphoribosyltransferase